MFASAGLRLGMPGPPPPIPSVYPGLRAGRGMSHTTWQACVEVLRRVYNTTDAGRNIAEMFREVPDDLDFPDYSRSVPDPESLDNVAAQLGNGSFESPEAFFKRLHQIFLNAKNYYGAGTDTYQDATKLEAQIEIDWRAMAGSGLIQGRTNPQPLNSAIPNNIPRRRGRPPKDPNKILANAVAASAALAQREAAMAAARRGPPPAPLYHDIPYDTPSIPGPSTAMPTAPLPVTPQYTPYTPYTPPTLVAAATSTPYHPPRPDIERSRSGSDTWDSPGMPDKLHQGAQSQADQQVVASLDARMPKWDGPRLEMNAVGNLGGISGSGWWGEGIPEYQRPTNPGQRMIEVVNAINGYKDHTGTRLADALDAVPETTNIPYLSFNHPLSFQKIRQTVEGSGLNLRNFDLNMVQLFEKARRHHASDLTNYGRVLVLQRLYNALTAPYPLTLPQSGAPEPSRNLFASLPAGPGNARSLHETNQDLRAGVAERDVGFGVTTFRVGTKDRIFTDEARHKGVAYKMGDYIHLINPDDATKPIIGQIFKTFVPTKGYRTHHVTVCWYYRPEQTVHPREQLFYEREVFKTGHFCDHPVEDILERVSVQFYVKAIRGRPLPPEYYPGWPIYVCNSRYNDKEWWFVRIKNWNSCIPDELRQTQFMTVEPFDRQVELGVTSSPFLRGITGPGHFGEAKSKGTAEDEDEDMTSRRRQDPIRRPTVSGYTPAASTPTATLNGSPSTYPGPNRMGNTNPTAGVYRPPQPQSQPIAAYGHDRRYSAHLPGQDAMKEHLPAETVKLFERDAQGQVLWFSGPPIAPGAIRIPEQPVHSLEYLTYLTKRKQGEDYKPSKLDEPRRKLASPSSDTAVTEENDAGDDAEIDLKDEWWTRGMTKEQAIASLKGVTATL